MEAELAALAASGATTLVGLMVSESWERAKSGLAAFFGRRGARRSGTAENDLGAARAELERARAAGDTSAQAAVQARLRQHLEAVFRQDAGAAEELARLLSELAPEASHTFVHLVTGEVNNGPVFQGSHIHGGIIFNVPSPPLPASAPAFTPDQVPPVTVPFSNRTAELAALDAVLGGRARGSAPTEGTAGPAGIGVGVLNGLPGVGKTTTAWRWASLARERFPDGQLYVDFAALRDRTGPSRQTGRTTPGAGDGTSNGAGSGAGDGTGTGTRTGAGTGAGTAGADVSEALAMCLRSLPGGDDAIPGSLAERTNLFRTRSAGLRILLVLDDVDQPAQVRALIPKGPGSAVLVTSQGRLGELTLDGARLISVRPLDAHGGLALLRDRCGAEAVEAEPEAAERLVELCGGLPVALQIVAARLATDDALSMTELAAELADETGRLPGLALDGPDPGGEEISVSAVLGSAYRLLPPDAARLYRLLGWLPTGVFDAGVAAVAAGTGTAGANRLLRALARASLVEAVGDGRFRMHDLVRLHARECAAREEAPAEQRALTERVGTHYLVLTACADRALRRDRLRITDLPALLRGVDDPFAAAGGPPPLEWLDTERAAVLAVLRAAVRQELNTLAWQLAEVFTAFFLHRRYLGAWRESLELGGGGSGGVGGHGRTGRRGHGGRGAAAQPAVTPPAGPRRERPGGRGTGPGRSPGRDVRPPGPARVRAGVPGPLPRPLRAVARRRRLPALPGTQRTGGGDARSGHRRVLPGLCAGRGGGPRGGDGHPAPGPARAGGPRGARPAHGGPGDGRDRRRARPPRRDGRSDPRTPVGSR
ncbi:NB-ARC domain-containing protein [Streptomyces sp. NPDC006743]|uniref:NB-ARC domain-containing protein n=1 Tax=Streptomyces sp. NPDC006743 TaxID=3154480 RepID=UPI0034563A5F